MCSVWFVVFFYLLAVYGCSVIITHSNGPFDVFLNLRLWAEDTSENLGMLFRCMLCMPTNIGIALSILNWFFVEQPVTPFNFILCETSLWWVAALLDGFVAGSFCRFVWNIEDYIDKNTPVYEDE